MRIALIFSVASVGMAFTVLPAWAQAASCLVVGESTARVASSEGEKSPVFLARSCESLRLVSGKAQASWVARDGKPRLVLITPQGVGALPSAGAEERPATVVLGELTSRRDRQQPAYMRNFGGDRAPLVFIPAGGLTLVERLDADAVITVALQEGREGADIQRYELLSGQPVVFSRGQLKAGNVYITQIQRGDLIEEWKWRITPSEEVMALDAHWAEIDAQVEDAYQRGLLKAMVFEQKRLRINMDFLLRELR